MDPTVDPRAKSFVTVAADSHFPLQNLPYGVFSPRGHDAPRVGVRIGDMVLDLTVIHEDGLLDEAELPDGIFAVPWLNPFMGLPAAQRRLVRARLHRLLSHDEPTLRDDRDLRARALRPLHACELHMPVGVPDYTDFYSSREHATNVGIMFRGAENALMPNWLHLPVGYHGRASSLVVSGQPVVRPQGQTQPAEGAPPVFGPSRLLDFELEMGFFIGAGNALGEPVPIDRAHDHIFGLVLVNDWSARDIQKWEYQPLGPFNAKNFATSVSPWVVPLEALAPFRCPAPEQEPAPLPYLTENDRHTFDIRLRSASAGGGRIGSAPALFQQLPAPLLDHGPAAGAPHDHRLQSQYRRSAGFRHHQRPRSGQLRFAARTDLARHQAAAHARGRRAPLPGRRRYGLDVGLVPGRRLSRGIRRGDRHHPSRPSVRRQRAVMGKPVGDILWTPSVARVAAARVTRFMAAAAGLGCAGKGAEDLWRWSVAQPEVFWRLVWSECGVIGDGPGDTVLSDGHLMPGARWFPQARLNYAENLLNGEPAAEVLVFREEGGRTARLDRAGLRGQVAAAAAALVAEGVGPGDRVAGVLPNVPETVVAMLAAASLGAVWTSCSPDFGRAGVLDRFGQVEPKVLIVSDGYRYGGRSHDRLPLAAELCAALPSVRRLVVVPVLAADSPLPSGAVLWESWLQPHEGAAPAYVRLPFAHPLFIMYSSGTTGLPKCMVHSAGGTLLQHLKEHQLHCDLGAGDRLFYFTTCGWMMWNWLVSGLASGAAVMLYDGHPLQPPEAIWDFAARERFTVLGTSARWLAACAKLGLRPRATHDLGALKAVLSTGSPLLPESFDWVYDAVGADLQLSSISGGTDIISCFALGSPVLPVRRGELQCRGLGLAVDVFGDDGRPLRDGPG